MSALAVRHVSRAYGTGRRRRRALVRCTFRVSAGEIVGVVGPNRAGKTTLLRLIAGELTPCSGEILVLGRRAGTRAARRTVSYASDPPLAPSELTGLEWLTYLASHRADAPAARLHLVQAGVELAELEDFVARRIDTYSRGMAQRLALAAAAITRGVVVLLDEVLSGIDPLVQHRLRAQIARLAGKGKAVLIASHDLSTVERLATRVLVLWEGRLTADLSTAALVRERVAELMLSRPAAAGVDRLFARYPGAVRTAEGLSIPLTGGLTIEGVLAGCRAERVPVSASRIRYRALEDILLAAEARSREGAS